MSLPTAARRQDAAVLPAPGQFSPARMVEAELTQPLPSLGNDGRRTRAWVLARLHTEPVGSCMVGLGDRGLTADQLGAVLWPQVRGAVRARFTEAGLPCPTELTGAGLEAAPGAWPFLRRRAEVLAAAPFISVVVCTRDRADRLETCLGQLGVQRYPRFEVVVVDNAPASGAVRSVIGARQRAVSCRYVAEPRGGLSWARNAGMAAASGEVIAFLDDDEAPDAHWLAEIARGFARADDIGCVTGMILPARLDTPVQEWFEQSGGHSKGRGFAPDVFSRDGRQSPFFPLPPFGAGGNMAFRRDALACIGGFDVAMGAGTPARASEDTLALTLTLLAGYRIAYEPAAFVRHDHYADLDGLGRQFRGYGTGLTAYYAALLRHRPSALPSLLKLVPTAFGYLRGAGEALGSDLPDGIKRQQRRGMLAGPVAYLRSVRRQARAVTRGAPR